MKFAQLQTTTLGLLATASLGLAACSGGGGSAPTTFMANPPGESRTATATVSASPTATATVSASPTATATVSASPTATATVSASPIAANIYRNGMLVPLYNYPNPTTAWDNVISLKRQHPSVPVYVIADASSGMGTTADANYQSIVIKSRAAGIKVLMYVASNYAATPLATVKGYIQNQVTFYGPIDGIFIDQMSNVAGNEAYFSSLTSYSHNLGAPFVVGNPGVDPLQSFVGTVDNIVTSENTTYPALATISSSKYTNAGPNAWSVIANATVFNSITEGEEKPYIGLIYATTDNVYGTLAVDLASQLNFLDTSTATATASPSQVASASPTAKPT